VYVAISPPSTPPLRLKFGGGMFLEGKYVFEIKL
jgi:hypothetical protein